MNRRELAKTLQAQLLYDGDPRVSSKSQWFARVLKLGRRAPPWCQTVLEPVAAPLVPWRGRRPAGEADEAFKAWTWIARGDTGRRLVEQIRHPHRTWVGFRAGLLLLSVPQKV